MKVKKCLKNIKLGIQHYLMLSGSLLFAFDMFFRELVLIVKAIKHEMFRSR